MTLIEETKAYNSLNIAMLSDHRKLVKLLEENKTWLNAWHNFKDKKDIDPEIEWQKLTDLGIKVFLKEDEEYPEALKEIPWAPHAIYVKGAWPLPALTSIAIVGTRKASFTGKNFARSLAKELSQNNLLIISGLALGIDESAHQGAIDAEAKTISVLPTSLDKIYPRQNENLAKKILELGGALISEYPINAPVFPSNFIARNRIISGLSSAVAVIEAPEKSGSLATARFAIEQNREVFVAPGPVNNLNYKGSHELIRAGARLVTCAKNILEDLGIDFKNPRECEIIKESLSAEEKKVFEILKKFGDSATPDKIAEETKFDITKINRIMTFLTIKGIIKNEINNS